MMKKYLSICLLVLTAYTMAGKKGVSAMAVEVTKQYPANDNSILELDVSFANVIVKTASNSEIKIVMTATGLIDDAACAEEVKDHFQQATKATANGVSLILNGVFDQCKVRKSCNVKVVVEITMPAKAQIKGQTSFGNIDLMAMLGQVKLKSDYGNVASEGLWSYTNDIKVEFGNMDISGSNGGRFEVDYGNISIGLLQGSAVVNCEFGNAEIRQITAACSHLNITAGYGNVALKCDSNVNYTFDVNSSYGQLDLDSACKVNYSDKDYTEIVKRGTIGNGSGKLYVKTEFGNLSLRIN